MLRQTSLACLFAVLLAVASAVSLNQALHPVKDASLIASSKASKQHGKNAAAAHHAARDGVGDDDADDENEDTDTDKDSDQVHVLNDENSHEPIYKEMSTAEKVAQQAEAEPAEPIELPFGTKISVPGLPPGSRVNPGGITPQQRAFDKKLTAQTEAQDIEEEEELSAERTLAENPSADVGDIVEEAKEVEAAENDTTKEDDAACTDCEDALAKIDAMAEKMEGNVSELANDDGYSAEEGNGETTTATMAAPAADEGYSASTDDGYDEAEDEGYAVAAEAAEAAEPVADEGYSASTDDGYDETEDEGVAAEAAEAAEPVADEGYSASTDDSYAAAAEAAKPVADEGYEEATTTTAGYAGDINLETEFLEITSSFTPENFLNRVSNVDAPLPHVLH